MRASRKPASQPLIRNAFLVAALALYAAAAAAEGPRTLGWLEWAWLEPGNIKIKTKLDTGARTSSLDARDVELFERDGEEWVRFRVPLADRPDDSDHGRDLIFERRVVRKTMIKDHVQKSLTRYVVDVDLCIGGIEFTTPVTLADRQRFNYPLLLGRLALQGRVVVDPASKFSARRSCRIASSDTKY